MGDKSGIEWTDATWNPVVGCSKVSPGCAHCYAETLSLRFGFTPMPWEPEYAERNVQLKPERLDQPLRWRRPRMVFVNSMSDLFHELVPYEYIDRVFEVMATASQHTYQVLTKRPERMRAYMEASAGPQLEPLPNVWLGTSIENSKYVGRADDLRATPAAVRFISAEPLLGSLVEPRRGKALDLQGIDWLIVGGESGGRQARPMQPQWVRELRDACLQENLRRDPNGLDNAGPAFFFKQWGSYAPLGDGFVQAHTFVGASAKAAGRQLDGRTWDEYPQAA